MSETNCPHCGKPAGVICIVAECPVRPPPPDPARITELQRRLAEGSVSNDPLIARVEALTRTVEGNLSPSQHQGDWVTVPREPTLNMIAEAAKALRWEDRASAIETVKPVLAAALAAAPPPPSPSEGVVEQIARIVKDGFIKRLPFEETARQIAALQASGEGEEGSLLHAGMTDPAPGAEPETAWLIERNGQWYAAAPHSRWTTQQAIDANTWRENWTTDANKALRFARKCDAETLIRYEGYQNAVATEHVWLAREEWPDLRDPRNVRAVLRQAQDNVERAAHASLPPGSPAPGASAASQHDHKNTLSTPPDTPEAIGAEVEERVARAICAAYGARYDNAFGSMSLETLDAHRAARAALSALHQAGKLP